VKEIIERRDDMIVISTFTKKSFEVLPIWRLSTMDPSGRTVSNVIQDQVRVCILHIGQDLEANIAKNQAILRELGLKYGWDDEEGPANESKSTQKKNRKGKAQGKWATTSLMDAG
jgi:hypothetical protein